MDSQVPGVGPLVIAKQDSELGQEILQKKIYEKIVVLVTPGAQFQHTGKQLRQLHVPQVSHLVEFFNPSEISELVRDHQACLQLSDRAVAGEFARTSSTSPTLSRGRAATILSNIAALS